MLNKDDAVQLVTLLQLATIANQANNTTLVDKLNLEANNFFDEKNDSQIVEARVNILKLTDK